jgi:Ricin-type beta-trefoil lectin domain-like
LATNVDILTHTCDHKGSPSNGTSVIGWQDVGGNADGAAFNQRWIVSPVDGQPDVYTLHNLHGGTSLDLSGGGSANGTRIQGWEFLNNRNQQWKISKAEVDGFWR